MVGRNICVPAPKVHYFFYFTILVSWISRWFLDFAKLLHCRIVSCVWKNTRVACVTELCSLHTRLTECPVRRSTFCLYVAVRKVLQLHHVAMITGPILSNFRCRPLMQINIITSVQFMSPLNPTFFVFSNWGFIYNTLWRIILKVSFPYMFVY